MHNYDVEAIEAARSKGVTAEVESHSMGEVGRALAAGETNHLGPEAMLHLQRMAGNASVARLLGEEEQAGPSPVKDVVGRGGGQPLEGGLQSDMEGRFGADFSGVRVHTDGQAAASAGSVNAHAYTVGNDIVFGSGRYDPASPTGQRTIAHELTHVVQQRSGPVDGTPAAGGIQLSNPADRFEQAAEQNAERLMTAQPQEAQPQAAEGEEEAVQALAVQREGEEDEEDSVQALAVQREGDDEEEASEEG